MQRNNRRRNNGNKKRGRRRLAQTTPGVAQNGAGVSHRDAVPNVRKFQIFEELPFVAASSDYALGMVNFNVSAGTQPFKALLTAYSGFYEQYRVRRMRVRAQVGKGYTNDRRLMTLIGSRVDVDNQPTTVNTQTIQGVNSCENTVIKTFTERGNILLADFRPMCRVNTTASLPLLPNILNWFPINDHNSHVWKGCTNTVMIPEPSLAPNTLSVTLIAEIDIEFRGRISDAVIFSHSAINQSPDEVITYDLTETQLELKNKLLTGAYQPLTAWPINIANIGTSVNSSEILGLTFRRNSDSVKFNIVMYGSDIYGANIFV
jgi:hypothetical protein